MDKEKEENVEFKIGEMKKQFQKSYEIFMNANAELSKLSFNNFSIKSTQATNAIANLPTKDIDDIFAAESLDDSIKILRTKINTDEDQFKNAFPDITKLINIMSNLQCEIDGLKEKQNDFAKLAVDVNEEMNRFEKELEATANQLSELTAEYSNEEEGEEADDEADSSVFKGEEGDDFDSDFDSD